MNVEIIVIGDELLIGQVTDTNSGDIARMLAPYGWTVSKVQTVSDNADEIRCAVEAARSRSRIVLTTGGLGPTKDDITKSVLCDIFGGTLVENSEVLDNVRRIFSLKGLDMNRLTASQALVPDTCTVIQNLVGTAPIMWFESAEDGGVLVAMPGVPSETRKMFNEAVLPRLLTHFGHDIAVMHHTLTVSGISESALAQHLEQWESSLPANLHLAYLPAQGIIRLRIDGNDTDSQRLASLMASAVDELRELTADYLLYDGGHSPQEELLNILAEQHLTVATAESCTGGNIGHLITSIPGSSRSMLGGVIAYSNAVKANVLEVSSATLDEHGAVSIPVVEQMAAGVQRVSGADVALATSGIAGPGGAVEGKPVGTVCIAVNTPRGNESRTWHFAGSREQVIMRASTTALVTAIKRLK